jgi:hypothetical protein
MSINRQARMVGLAWERLMLRRIQLILEIISRLGKKYVFYLGPHPPRLTPREIELLHKLWLEFSQRLDDQELHHHDVVYFALKELEREIAEGKSDTVLERLRQHLLQHRK